MSRVQVAVGGESIEAELENTGGWGNAKWKSVGSVEVGKAGVRQVTLSPLGGADWKAVNVWGVRLVPEG